MSFVNLISSPSSHHLPSLGPRDWEWTVPLGSRGQPSIRLALPVFLPAVCRCGTQAPAPSLRLESVQGECVSKQDVLGLPSERGLFFVPGDYVTLRLGRTRSFKITNQLPRCHGLLVGPPLTMIPFPG